MCVQETLEQIESKKPLVTLAFLDCCREHASVRRTAFGKDLSTLKGPAGSLVMYATGQGKLASDGSERNGPFTAALLKQLRTPGLALEQLAANVRNDVKEMTGGRQKPQCHVDLDVVGLCLVPPAD